MSAIAGLVRWDGGPADAEALARMTGAMRHRAPEGIAHWHQGPATLGHGALRTTPESLHEAQPLADAEGTRVLVLDGILDNREDIRDALRSLDVRVRGDSDAELILQAYLAWGEACAPRLIGEFAFFVWDATRRALFGARDGVGCRYFHYHAAPDRFAFASEIRGLLAEGRIAPRLNRERLLDYLSDEFDREDETGTFYQGILRLPAGHALRATSSGVQTWRYWHPENLAPLPAGTDCVEGYLSLFREAVRCRLRSRGPVGALLSGGLDSSATVALIGRELRSHTPGRLKTFSLEPRLSVDPEAQGRREILSDPWFDATQLSLEDAAGKAPPYAALLEDADEPFAISHGFADRLLADAAAREGCRVLMDGMASDLYYFAPPRSLASLLHQGRFDLLAPLLSGVARHGSAAELAGLARILLGWLAPRSLRTALRQARDRHGPVADALSIVRPALARAHLSRRRQEREQRVRALTGGSEDPQAMQAADFASGMLSFAHEFGGPIALGRGVEPRSPYSDRRLVEFAIALPLEWKIAGPWQKALMRQATAGILPDALRWRAAGDGFPGSLFLNRYLERDAAVQQSRRLRPLYALVGEWLVDETRGPRVRSEHLQKLWILSDWMAAKNLSP